jgi:hypothetical protein
MTGWGNGVVFGINWFNTYYTAFDMENRRVGFAESIYSNLTPEQSKEFNSKALINLSEVDMADYLAENEEFEIATGVVCALSALLLIGAIIRYNKM